MDAEDEADGVKDVGFARAVEAGDGIEMRVESDRDEIMVNRDISVSLMKSSDSKL